MSRNNGNYHEKRIANLTSPEAIELAMSLVANLIGPENNLPLMGEARLTPKTFPKTDNPDLEFARTVLRMIYTAVEEGLPPTKENIMPRLLLELGREEAERGMERLMSFRAIEDAPDAVRVSALSTALSDAIVSANLIAAGRDTLEIATKNFGSNIEVYNAMLERMMEAAPQRIRVFVNPLEENLARQERILAEREARLESQGSVGPETPWPRLNRMIAGGRKGDITLISAKTGYGKSTLALLMALHQAWTQGYDVALMHFEQYTESILDRLLAHRFSLLPVDFRKPGKITDPKQTRTFSLKDPRWERALNEFKAHVKRMSEEKGNIWLIHATGWTPAQIAAEIAQRAAMAYQNGRELVVHYDYLDLISSEGLKKDGDGMVANHTAVMDFLRDEIGQQFGIYTYLYAQDDLKANYRTRLMPYGGQKALHRSQVYVRLERYYAEDSEIVTTKDADGNVVQKVDMFGRPIFKHKAGQLHSRSLLHVIKGSDDETGFVPVEFINGRFQVREIEYQSQEQLKTIIDEVYGGNRAAPDTDNRNDIHIPF
ncbi:MAG: hypothetical protein DCC55_27620 [Chloroflexi bacterium]|nr:MAG: hypothetical protein DCC55_27620 [Chloroflexota bacterium]